jgi:phage gp29-like protein
VTPAIDGWLETIKAMLAAAGSLEEFRNMLLAAYPKLDDTALVSTMTAAFTAMELRGRADIEDET